ncbi:MAG: nicotinate phosphoribosyltransferase [Deltaproteobacteria bacterium]|nr:nicotinate phosphoribosyltransferase [Deltaproteobacteria bacterium]
MTTLYRQNLTLLTDLYQLTMAYAYWKTGLADREAVFHLSFRKKPFQGGYAIACGLETACELLSGFGFDDESLSYLASLAGNDGKPLFEPGFLDYLADLRLGCDVHAVPEGSVVFPHEPLLRIKGPIAQCQIVETPLLNCINFETLIATKAARICLAARGDPVLEFGLRRAQGADGGLHASRAAFVGGCSSTSNVLAGRLFDIPVKGTHAHSWVMCFDDELSAFEAYAAAMPNNCVFLVDTYDTIQGVHHAIQVGEQLRAQGHEMVGIRLDSGDLAFLSIEARKLLNEADFADAAILASNDLDEHIISSLKQQGATIAVWGVGTKLATAFDQPALGGIYKLSAIRDEKGLWQHRLKLSEQAIKISTPGMLQVRRYYSEGGEPVGDCIFDEILGMPAAGVTIVDPSDSTRRKSVPADAWCEDLLLPAFEAGRRVYDPPGARAARERSQRELGRFHAGIKRLVHPHQYPVGLEKGLSELKHRLICEARGIE